ncbi:MAG: hypothetical protein HYZ43_17155 [Flavobacteriia bacterium]|nr:hypothetical protein [Flavobacteriia bacterium]
MDLIKFEWLGLHLQEPMAIIMNGLISLFCFFAFFRLRKWGSEANYWWRMFYLIFGISTFFGALGHAFFSISMFTVNFLAGLPVALPMYALLKECFRFRTPNQ